MEVMEIATKVWDEKRITEEDYRKIMEATTYLLGYFSRNYADLKLSKEVSEVMESFYYKAKDEGRRERNLQTAQKMLKKGLSLDLICEITELPRETVERLGKEIAN
jgi:predicted transposase YdaD